MSKTNGPVERGPNYDWQHEVDHWRDEYFKLQKLLGQLEMSTERLQDKLDVAVEAFQEGHRKGYLSGDRCRWFIKQIRGDDENFNH